VNKKYTWVDSFKGIAICGVVLIHTGGSNLPSILGKIGDAGARGVQMFFIISAFLTFLSLGKCFAVSERNLYKKSVVKWLLKRFLRIAPLYYIVLIYSLLATKAGAGSITPLNILSHFCFLNAFFPHYINSILSIEWYIADLPIFYLISILIFQKINTSRKAFILMSISVVCSLIVCYLLYYLVGNNNYDLIAYFLSFSFITEFPLWAIGIFLYFLFREGLIAKYKGNRMISYALMAISLCFIGSLIIGGNNYMMLFLFGIGFACLIVSQEIHTCKIINNKLWASIGKNSYGIYLFHLYCMGIYQKYCSFPNITNHKTIKFGISYIIILAISYILAIIARHVIENPLVKLGNKILDKK